MTNEKWLTKKMLERFKRIHLQSFEASRIPRIPDLLAIYEGWTFWIEAKIMDNVDSRIPYQPGQEAWIQKWRENGGDAFTICGLTSSRQVAIFPLGEVVDLLDPEWTERVETLLISFHRGSLS